VACFEIVCMACQLGGWGALVLILIRVYAVTVGQLLLNGDGSFYVRAQGRTKLCRPEKAKYFFSVRVAWLICVIFNSCLWLAPLASTACSPVLASRTRSCSRFCQCLCHQGYKLAARAIARCVCAPISERRFNCLFASLCRARLLSCCCLCRFTTCQCNQYRSC